MNHYLLFGLALVALWFVLQTFSKEKFQPEFLDTRQVAKTISKEDSSYEQSTNHMTPAPYDMGPVQGTPSIWQVNQYRSYIK